MLSNAEIVSLVSNIARTQAELYYKEEEVKPSELVVACVATIIQAIVLIQLVRAGLQEEDHYKLDFIPYTILQEMKTVGWNVDDLE